MNEGRTVFAQLLDYLPKYEFDKCVQSYRGNFRVRKLPAYEQFVVLAFAQLTWRESLRDIETCLRAIGASSATLLKSSFNKLQRSTRTSLWRQNSNKLPSPWTPPPSICACRCF